VNMAAQADMAYRRNALRNVESRLQVCADVARASDNPALESENIVH